MPGGKELETQSGFDQIQKSVAEVNKPKGDNTETGQTLLLLANKILENFNASEEEIKTVLELMIVGTGFAEARVELVPSHLKIDPFNNMYSMLGKRATGNAYHVWFVNDGGQWIVRYKKVSR